MSQPKFKRRPPSDPSTAATLKALGFHSGIGGTTATHHEHSLRQQEKPDVRRVKRWQLVPSDKNPRKVFPRRDLVALGHSIAEHGQIHACIVRVIGVDSNGNTLFEIVTGEKRWRSTAPEFGNLEEVLVDVRLLSDAQAMALRIAENAERSDVSALEFAQGLRDFYESLENPTWEIVAGAVDLSVPRIMQFQAMLKILDLSEKIQAAFYPPEFWEEDGKPFFLNEVHSRALLELSAFPQLQNSLFKEIMNLRLSGTKAHERAKELLPIVKERGRTGSKIKTGKPKPSPKTETKPAEQGSGSTERTSWAGGVSVAATVAPQVSPEIIEYSPSPLIFATRFEQLMNEANKAGGSAKDNFDAAVLAYLDQLTGKGEA